MAKRKRYSSDFQLEAARLVVEHGYTFKEVAKRLGATDWSIRQWVQKFRKNGQLPPVGTTLPEADEMRRLSSEFRVTIDRGTGLPVVNDFVPDPILIRSCLCNISQRRAIVAHNS